ncbi:MAG: hypothetical protein ACTHLE_14270 [Agriterribacter sp.]
MNIDEVITNAFKEIVPGEGFFIIEGHPLKNDIRIRPADKAMMDNLACLAWSLDLGYQYLGTFTNEQNANRQISVIRSKLRDEQGNKLLHTNLALSEAGIELVMYEDLWLVEVHPLENKVRVTMEAASLTTNMEAFAAGEHVGYQFVSLHMDEALGREMEQRIRKHVRDEAGNRLAFDVRLRKR